METGLLFTSDDLRRQGEEHPERRAGPAGDLQRLRRGIYADAGTWRTASLDGRYLLRILAAEARLQTPHVFSHESALRLLDLPSLRPWPAVVHVIDERRGGGRSRGDVVRHSVWLDAIDVMPVDDLACTSPARTALDLALGRSFSEAVVVADAVVARYPGGQEDLAELLRLLPPGTRGIRRACRVASFADARSQSPGESWSRALIAELGFAAPSLQQPIFLNGRRVGIVDFEWTRDRIVGEFDGEVKYRRADYLQGRAPEQIVIEEKNRENAIRRTGRNVVRWTWDDLRDRRRLAALLTDAGVPRQGTAARRSPSAP